MSAPPRGRAVDDSRGSRPSKRPALPDIDTSLVLGIVLFAAAVGGPLLLIFSDFSTLIEIKVLTVSKKTISGGSHHAYAMLVLGLAALPMAYGAVRTGTRPAMLALAVLGVIAGLIALVGDLPDIHKTGTIGRDYANAHAYPRAGFYMETLGAALLLIAGGGGLVLTGAGRDVPRLPRRRERPVAAPAAAAPDRTPTTAERAEQRARARAAKRPEQ